MPEGDHSQLLLQETATVSHAPSSQPCLPFPTNVLCCAWQLLLVQSQQAVMCHAMRWHLPCTALAMLVLAFSLAIKCHTCDHFSWLHGI